MSEKNNNSNFDTRYSPENHYLRKKSTQANRDTNHEQSASDPLSRYRHSNPNISRHPFQTNESYNDHQFSAGNNYVRRMAVRPNTAPNQEPSASETMSPYRHSTLNSPPLPPQTTERNYRPEYHDYQEINESECYDEDANRHYYDSQNLYEDVELKNANSFKYSRPTDNNIPNVQSKIKQWPPKNSFPPNPKQSQQRQNPILPQPQHRQAFYNSNQRYSQDNSVDLESERKQMPNSSETDSDRNRDLNKSVIRDIKELLNEQKKQFEKIIDDKLEKQREDFESKFVAFKGQSSSNNSVNQSESSNNTQRNSNNFNTGVKSLKVKPNINKSAQKSSVDFSSNMSGEFQILLLGGTGTGKSTLINTIANYFLNGSLDNIKVVIPTKFFRHIEPGYARNHSEINLEDQTKSKTSQCLLYTFLHPNNKRLKFVFIDTPGLSDTEGTEQDDRNIATIIDAAIKATTLSAIVVIASGTVARVTSNIKTTLVKLANNLPDVIIQNNLLLVLTMCAKIGATFEIDSFVQTVAKPLEVFYIDNQAFASDPSKWRDDGDEYEKLEQNWRQSQRTFDGILKRVTQMGNTSTESFQSMKQLRNELKAKIAIIGLDIANIQKVQNSLFAAQRALEISGDQKQQFADYTKNETVTQNKIVDSDFHSTVCTTHLLKNMICHENCGLELTENSGSNFFTDCACMGSDGQCDECRCGPTSHYHAFVKLISVTETVEKILEDMKAQFDAADSDYQKYESDTNQFQATLDQLQAAADQKYRQIHELCYELSAICSRFNFVDELHANIENMKQEARLIKSNDLRDKAEDEIRKLIKLAEDLTAGGNQSQSAKPNKTSATTKPKSGKKLSQPKSSFWFMKKNESDSEG